MTTIAAVVGVDGGATKTRCVVLACRGANAPISVLGSFTSGPSNHNSVGGDDARRAVLRATNGALRAATAAASATTHIDVRGISFCLSGVDTTRDKEMVESWLRDEQRRAMHVAAGVRGDDKDGDDANAIERARCRVWLAAMQKRFIVVEGDDDADAEGTDVAGRGGSDTLYVVIENDAVGALCSGTKGVLRGAALICGTGTIAVAFGGRRRRARAAGWGAAFGDGGCGYDIGYKALCTTARLLDGRLDSEGGRDAQLVQRVLRVVGATSADELLTWAYRTSGDDEAQHEDATSRRGAWDRVAAIAPAVLAAAATGDPHAQRIVSESADELAASVEAVVVRSTAAASSTPHEARSCWSGDVVLVGGVLTDSEGDARGRGTTLLVELRKRLSVSLPSARVVVPEAEPAMGAAWLIDKLVTRNIHD